MERLLLSFSLSFVLAVVSPVARAEQPNMSGEAMRSLLAGNTMSGRHFDGMVYSEWHAPDGRVFGHNNHEPVEKGCWDIRGDEVCYYYSGGTVRGEFCWTFQQRTQTGFTMRSTRTGLGALGILEQGNPHGHSDNGKPWSCEPLSSERKGSDERRRAGAAGSRIRLSVKTLVD